MTTKSIVYHSISKGCSANERGDGHASCKTCNTPHVGMVQLEGEQYGRAVENHHVGRLKKGQQHCTIEVYCMDCCPVCKRKQYADTIRFLNG